MTGDENPHVDCRRGLACVQRLPREQGCDLCADKQLAVVLLPNQPWPFSYICSGWIEIVNRLVAELCVTAPGWRVTQIKKKFGGLRFGVDLPDGLSAEERERVYAVLRAAEEESLRVCDICGAVGSMRTAGHWWRTRCEEHRDLGPREIENSEAVLAKIEFPEGEEYRP